MLSRITDILRVLFTPVRPVEIPPNVQRIEAIPYSLLCDASIIGAYAVAELEAEEEGARQP